MTRHRRPPPRNDGTGPGRRRPGPSPRQRMRPTRSSRVRVSASASTERAASRASSTFQSSTPRHGRRRGSRRRRGRRRSSPPPSRARSRAFRRPRTGCRRRGGVVVRRVRVRLGGTGEVAARRLALLVGVVDVLDPAASEQAVGIARDVARGVHVVTRGAQLRVHVHPVVDREAGLLGQVGGHLDPETAHDGVGAHLVAVLERERDAVGIRRSTLDLRPRHDLDARVAEELLETLRERGGEDRVASTAPVWMSTVSTPFCTRAAASSEPMYPPPTTAMRSTSSARERSRR